MSLSFTLFGEGHCLKSTLWPVSLMAPCLDAQLLHRLPVPRLQGTEWHPGAALPLPSIPKEQSTQGCWCNGKQLCLKSDMVPPGGPSAIGEPLMTVPASLCHSEAPLSTLLFQSPSFSAPRGDSELPPRVEPFDFVLPDLLPWASPTGLADQTGPRGCFP